MSDIVAIITESPDIILELKDGHVHANKSILDATTSPFTIEDREYLYRGTFIYEQMIASNEWIIDHNLGKYPSIHIVDSANSIVSGDVRYISLNQLVVSFIGEFSGKAYLN